ncbi:MAG TPA: hypothetical protein VGS11_04805 [Candidatus Bathyarchaeia archaeon]|nr:hypothetical protein [Candidatus Bathyarchaeia archaeon]
MNFRPAVEDSALVPSKRADWETRYITFGSEATVAGIFSFATMALASLASLAETKTWRLRISNRREH